MKYGVGDRVRSYFVETDPVGTRIRRIGEVLIDEAGSIGQPLCGLRAAVNHERQRLARINLHQSENTILLPLAIDGIREQLAVLRWRDPRDAGHACRIEV